MTVNPGFGGQAYIPTMLPKIRMIRKWIVDRGLEKLILRWMEASEQHSEIGLSSH